MRKKINVLQLDGKIILRVFYMLVLSSIAMSISAETLKSFEPEMVQLPTGIWMGKYEVTQKQWQAVMGNNPSFHPQKDDFPVGNVSWNDVQIFIAQLNKKTGKTYRLPTEKEWIEACQADKHYKYCGSDNVDVVAWHGHNSDGIPHSVGQKMSNAWGLYDMSGNVWEWTSSHSNKYEWSTLCGGSWRHLPEESRSANCHNFSPDNRSNFQGFRLVKN